MIFIAGVLVILTIIALFVSLHVNAINKIDDVNKIIVHLNQKLFKVMADDGFEEINLQLKDRLYELEQSETLKKLLLVSGINLDWNDLNLHSKEDLLNT